MANESPLFHDGSNFQSGSDLSAAANQFKAIKQTSARKIGLAGAGDAIAGILQNTPALGDAADVGYFGVSKALVGSAGATAMGALKVDSTGALIDQGGSGTIVAYALDTGASGDIISVRLASPAG